jgi:glycosyltransferase involved in cell wall biosynthesis
MPKSSVSVIIPAFDAAHSLSRCLDSVLDQTLKPREILVVNDGSTDETAEVVRSYGREVEYLEQENRGPAEARNAGLRRATGEFVAFLDADDRWFPRFLETTLDFLDRNRTPIAVSTGLLIRSARGKERAWPRFLQLTGTENPPLLLEDFFTFWSEHDHIRTGSAVFRSAVIQQAGLQRGDLRIGEDLEYWGYLATFGQWAFIPEILWIGESRANARHWKERYAERRALCPTVESWQERILPRLESHELASFKRVRGRVAANYAHHKIIAGDTDGALAIVRRFGGSMPDNPITRLELLGAGTGSFGWKLACFVLRTHEIAKDRLLRWTGGSGFA